MGVLCGNCLVGQSGGPTAAINATLLGVIKAATSAPEIRYVYGMLNGIEGVIRDEIIDLGAENPNEIKKLKYTPSSILGSCRYKLDVDRDCRRILEVLKSHDIRYFFYIGGNDSMDTCNKISKYLTSVDYDCRVIGVPKTIDNDLVGTDHCPGYGSAAKFIATACMELKCDTEVYRTPTVNIVEIMGRHAGWLAGAAALGNALGNGPDLVYLPECDFNMEQFYQDVQKVIDKSGSCLVAVSEGIHYADGSYIQDLATAANDGFGHVQLGGLGVYLADLVKANLHCKARGIELSLLQRCSSHCAAETDLNESISAGMAAVGAALAGKSDIMIGFIRNTTHRHYTCNTCEFPLTGVANAEKTVPRAWINDAGNGVTQDFIDYALPLIQGEPNRELDLSLPCFAKFKKIHC